MVPNMEISTVVGCKMRCDYCPQKIHVGNYAKGNKEFTMTMETFKECLSKIPKHVEIYFAGMAEPWLNPEATEMVLFAHLSGYKIGVYTTLSGMTLRDADLIQHIPFVHFCIHLPDLDGRMNYQLTDEYIQILKACMKIPGHNFMMVGRMIPGIESITGKVPDASPGLFSRAGNLKHLIIPRKKGALQCSACGPKIDHNILLPNGDVLLCCMDYAQEHVIGNLLEMSYDNLFESEEYQRIQKGLKDESIDILCRKCEVSEKA